jgi:hypothetical protein
MGLNDKPVIAEPERTHAVITMQGNKHLITLQQFETLQILSLDDMLRIDVRGTSIKISTIAEVLPLEEFYKQYPDQKPAVYSKMEWLEEVPQGIDGLLANAPKRGLEEMIKGIRKFIKENPGAEKAKILARRMIQLHKSMQG